MAHGIKFGSFHSWDDLGVNMDEAAPGVGMATVRENYMDVPGGTFLDASEYPSNRPTYKQREMSFGFIRKNAEEAWPTVVSRMMNAIHGKSMDIILDDDPAWKYHGRIKVQAPNTNVPFTRLPVTATVLPYKEYLRSVADEWIWDETDFGRDENLIDGGLTDVTIGDTNIYTVKLPYSPCGGLITVSATVTGLYGSATSGQIRIANSDSSVTLKNITESGTYSISATAAYSEQCQAITVQAVNLVGALTVDFTPRSL